MFGGGTHSRGLKIWFRSLLFNISLSILFSRDRDHNFGGQRSGSGVEEQGAKNKNEAQWKLRGFLIKHEMFWML